MRLDPFKRAELLADGEAMRALLESPGWARYVELLQAEKAQQVSYLEALPPDREIARLIGVRHGLQKAIGLPQTIIEMARQV